MIELTRDEIRSMMMRFQKCQQVHFDRDTDIDNAISLQVACQRQDKPVDPSYMATMEEAACELLDTLEMALDVIEEMTDDPKAEPCSEVAPVILEAKLPSLSPRTWMNVRELLSMASSTSSTASRTGSTDVEMSSAWSERKP